MNGWVTIGVKANSKQFEKDMREVERKLKNADKELADYQKKHEQIIASKTKTEEQMKTYDAEIKRYEKLVESAEKYRLEIKELEKQKAAMERNGNLTGAVNLQERIDSRKIGYSELNREAERQSSAYQRNIDKYEQARQKLAENTAELTKINEKIVEAAKNQEALNQNAGHLREKLAETKYFDKMKQSIDNVGDSMGKIAGKAVKWALAIFGIRSIYSAITRSVSILSQYDDQLAADISYIQFALASTLKPIIEWIVNTVYTLLQYINSLVYQLFGINLFANATFKAFNKTKKEVSDIKKQLAGFDEMNVLADTSTGAGSSAVKPKIDLSELQEVDLTKIGKDIDKGIDAIKNIFVKAFEKIKQNVEKVLLDIGFSERFVKYWGTLVDGLKNQILAFFDIITGVVEAFIGLITGDTELFYKGFERVLKGITELFTGSFKTWIGMIGMLITGIADLITGIFKWIANLFKDNPVTTSFNAMGNSVKKVFSNLITYASQSWAGIKNVFGNVAKWFGDTFSNAWSKVRDVFSTGGKIFIGIKEGIVDAFKTIVNKLIDGINAVVGLPFRKLNDTLNSIRNVKVLNVAPFKGLWGNDPIAVPKLPHLHTGAILNMPGKGVYHDGSIIAERGAEGILPLTDASAMELLGKTIGKYITINANISNILNGRVVSRLMKEIMADQEFASNG